MKFTRMQLWILKRKSGPLKYDETHGVIVRAASPAAARKLAADVAGDEGRDVWLYAKNSTARVLKAEGVEGVVMIDYLEG